MRKNVKSTKSTKNWTQSLDAAIALVLCFLLCRFPNKMIYFNVKHLIFICFLLFFFHGFHRDFFLHGCRHGISMKRYTILKKSSKILNNSDFNKIPKWGYKEKIIAWFKNGSESFYTIKTSSKFLNGDLKQKIIDQLKK